MLILPTAPPVDYSLCNQAVTVYRSKNGRYTTTVYKNAFIDYRKVESVDKTGSKESSGFLLVIPGNADIEQGDKIYHGEGAEVTSREEWANLIPAKVPGLCVVSYVDKKYWQDRVCHVEAGG